MLEAGRGVAMNTPRCDYDKHQWEESYYGMTCKVCGALEPSVWLDDDEDEERAYDYRRVCSTCGGEITEDYSTCTCDDDDDDLLLLGGDPGDEDYQYDPDEGSDRWY